jgi:hypothetical protein
MPQYTADTPRYISRYENVDVLSMLDPEWLERSQARKLIQMVAEADRSAGREDRKPEPEPMLSL